MTLFLLIKGDDEDVVLLEAGLKGEARESPLVLIRLLLLLLLPAPPPPPDGGPLVVLLLRFGDSIEGRRIL